MTTPRGIRNCNPLNIRRTGDQWRGLADIQTDASFCQFRAMEWGWRAAFRLLTHTYYRKYGIDTIRAIVSRWAPAADNNDETAYTAHIIRLTGIAADEPLGNPQEQAARWMMVALAMAIHENGTAELDPFAMLQGWQLCQQA